MTHRFHIALPKKSKHTHSLGDTNQCVQPTGSINGNVQLFLFKSRMFLEINSIRWWFCLILPHLKWNKDMGRSSFLTPFSWVWPMKIPQLWPQMTLQALLISQKRWYVLDLFGITINDIPETLGGKLLMMNLIQVTMFDWLSVPIIIPLPFPSTGESSSSLLEFPFWVNPQFSNTPRSSQVHFSLV